MNARKLLSAAKAVEPAYIEDVFSTYLYTGNGSTQTITNGIDLSGKGGLVWLKTRDTATTNHGVYDTERGAGKYLFTNATNAQATNLSGYDLTSFTSTGFTLGTPQNSDWNTNNKTNVAWTFRKQAKFFDCFTYTGTGSSLTLSHSLGSTPGCIILKRTDTSSTFGWLVWHQSVGANNLRLNSTEAAGATFANQVSSVTSTQFTIGTTGDINANGGTYVAYLFAHDAGGFGLSGSDNVISCGSFTTDGSGNATVNLGYEPQFMLFKSSTTTTAWRNIDTMRGWNLAGTDYTLEPNTSRADQTDNFGYPTATGFYMEAGAASQTFIYIAIRRGPMKTPTSGTSVYNAIARTGTGAAATVTGVGFAPDLSITQIRNNTYAIGAYWFDRLRGVLNQLRSTNTDAEASLANSVTSFNMDGVSLDSAYQVNSSGDTFINWYFRRAPGFFDVVCYTGGGFVNETIAHNLTVVPEFVIIKRRNTTELWWVNAIFGSTTFLQGSLNTTDFLPATTYSFGGFAKPTATSLVFNSGNSSMHASGGTYVAYLFATCPGVSKVGSYTGTGSTLQIDCGFTGGARFVLIKRTDNTGDWYVWDSARGIVAGNDPYLLLNSTAAEVTTTDWVDTHSPGFELSSAVGNNANINTASYIFLAIA